MLYLISKTVRGSYKIPTDWSSSCYWQYTKKLVHFQCQISTVNTIRKTEKCNAHAFVIFYTKEKQKSGILFGDYQPSEELSAVLEGKSGKIHTSNGYRDKTTTDTY